MIKKTPVVSLNHMAGGFCSPTYRANLSTSVSSCVGYKHLFMADTGLPRSCGWLSTGLQFRPSEAQDLVGDGASPSWTILGLLSMLLQSRGVFCKSPRPPQATLHHSPMCLADSPEHYFCNWSRETQKKYYTQDYCGIQVLPFPNMVE